MHFAQKTEDTIENHSHLLYNENDSHLKFNENVIFQNFQFQIFVQHHGHLWCFGRWK